jgi:hypothetical protein
MLLLGIISHYLFCVETTISKWINFVYNKSKKIFIT